MICKEAKKLAAEKDKKEEEIRQERDFMFFKGICPHCANTKIIYSNPIFSDKTTMKCEKCGLVRIYENVC